MPEVTMNGYEFTAINIFKQTFNLNNHKDPSHISSIVSKCSVASFSKYSKKFVINILTIF